MFKLDHIGIAVPELEGALKLWRDQLGIQAGEIETIATQKVRAVFLDTGACRTELIEATSDDSPIASFLASGRKGVHHIAYRVENLAQLLTRLKKDGVPLIHEQTTVGSGGSQIAFLHPRGTGGVLVELVEYPG
ncbi:MAG: methylmalonyl-CoA epimerase [Planctomycetota bacterium]